MKILTEPVVTPHHRVLKSAIHKLNRMNAANEAMTGLCRNTNSLNDVNAEGLSQILCMINNGYYEVLDELERLDKLENEFERIDWLEKEIPRKQELYDAYSKSTDTEVQKIAESSGKTLELYKSELETLEKSVADFAI
jgi:hypothetical protein